MRTKYCSFTLTSLSLTSQTLTKSVSKCFEKQTKEKLKTFREVSHTLNMN